MQNEKCKMQSFKCKRQKNFSLNAYLKKSRSQYMNASGKIKDRISEARASLEEAKSLLDEGMDLSFVMNSLYYAMLYSVNALLESRQVAIATQSVSVASFDKEFIETDIFERRFSDTLHKTFELRRSCACETPRDITKKDAEALVPQVEAFLDAVDRYFRSA